MLSTERCRGGRQVSLGRAPSGKSRHHCGLVRTIAAILAQVRRDCAITLRKRCSAYGFNPLGHIVGIPDKWIPIAHTGWPIYGFANLEESSGYNLRFPQ